MDNTQDELKSLRSQLSDLQIMYENTVEHGTSLENELEEKNLQINKLLDNMRRYLSPQLYESILGGELTTDFSYQRKKLTIFFSDLVGFTSLTDSVEPEVMSDCLNAYLNEMSSIAMKYGGTIDKFIGDAIMIFFGAPQSTSDADHAERCVRMAVEMQSKMPLIQRIWNERGIAKPVQMRIGINTGFCTVGNFGSDQRVDYTIIGGQVNIASRLETFASPGKTIISGSTHAFVKDTVEARALGEVNVKGVHYPIEVYEVTGFKEEATQNPYIQKLHNGFSISAIDYDPASVTTDQKKQIKEALEQARLMLDR